MLVVARAASEVTGRGMISPGQRPVCDAVAVDVSVSAPFATYLLQVGLAQHLATVERLVGIAERRCHPQVHSEVQVGEHEYSCLEPIGVIECVAAEVIALLHRAGEQDQALGVSAGQRVSETDICLRGTRGKPGVRSDTLALN